MGTFLSGILAAPRPTTGRQTMILEGGFRGFVRCSFRSRSRGICFARAGSDTACSERSRRIHPAAAKRGVGWVLGENSKKPEGPQAAGLRQHHLLPPRRRDVSLTSRETNLCPLAYQLPAHHPSAHPYSRWGSQHSYQVRPSHRYRGRRQGHRSCRS